MSLAIYTSGSLELLAPELLGALRSAQGEGRPVVLLVPSLSMALEVSRGLSAYPELSLGITCTTPLAWVRERWEVWGDGRTLVDPSVRYALCYKLAVMDGRVSKENPLSATKGMARTLAALVKDVLPWLAAGQNANLAAQEQAVVDLALRYGEVLTSHSYIEPCSAMAELPRIFAAQHVSMPAIFAAGFADAPFSTVELLADLSAITPVGICVHDDGTPRCELPRTFASRVKKAAEARGIEVVLHSAVSQPAPATGELVLLSHALYRAGEPGVELPQPTGAVHRAIATGPFAEHPLVVDEVMRLVGEGASSIVVCAADVGAAWRGLAPRLAAHGLAVQGEDRVMAALAPAGRAFLSFASSIAALAQAARAWDDAQPGDDLSMDWWPPRAITDFLLSSISGVSEEDAWNLDKRLRGNRALTPRAVLDLLQRESTTSHACAQAVRLLEEGRIGSAAHLLARELALPEEEASSDDIFVLEAIAQMQASVAHLGLSVSGDSTLEVVDLAELLTFICSRLSVSSSLRLGPDNAPATVRICSRAQAAQLEPASADAVVLMQLTSAEWPLKQADDAAARLLDKLGISAASEPLPLARYRFACAVSAARSAVVLESSAHDLDTKPTYPAVVLAELLSCYPEDAELPCSSAAEDAPTSKLSASGNAPAIAGVSQLPEQDYIADTSMLILPRMGGIGDVPLALSATQIETYLDCPLKWFTQSRVKIDGIDADFGGMQKGSFAHVVLERTHRELLRRAAVSQGLIGPEDSADAIAAPYVAGARVSAANLSEADALLDAVFDEHLAGQKERALRKESQSLVPHTASERNQIKLLRRDLHTTLAFEAERLEGFEPRWFELRFGRGEGARTVTYAGAEFVGTIDRIDVDAHGNALIIDYKHKNPAGFAGDYSMFSKDGPEEPFTLDALALPRHIQTLAYAQIVRRLYPQLRVVGAVYLATMGAVPEKHVIAGLATPGVLPRVLGEKAAASREKAMCPPEGVEFGELLDTVEELVARAIANLADARIQAEPRDKESCRFCPVMRCERRLA